MRGNAFVACLMGATLLGTCVAQSVVSDGDMIEYDRRLAENHKTAFPAAGVIPMQRRRNLSRWRLQYRSGA